MVLTDIELRENEFMVPMETKQLPPMYVETKSCRESKIITPTHAMVAIDCEMVFET